MAWIGKLGGGLLGAAVLGPMGLSVLGAMIGVAWGHQFDRSLASRKWRVGDSSGFETLSGSSLQKIFFETSFLVMGHLAKADGHVSEQEIRAARSVMHQMRLRPEEVQHAIALFSKGKSSNFDIDTRVTRFRQACRGQPGLIRTFLEIQMDLALSKGAINSSERELLWRIAGHLGVGRVELVQLEAVLLARRNFSGQQRSTARRDDSLEAAYKALGVPPAAPDKEVKTAYRRLMNQHHPDKQLARGLPDSMMEIAKKRTREIRSAYDLIKQHRGMR